jgi:hypothetical protein
MVTRSLLPAERVLQYGGRTATDYGRRSRLQMTLLPRLLRCWKPMFVRYEV